MDKKKSKCPRGKKRDKQNKGKIPTVPSSSLKGKQKVAKNLD